MVYLEDRDEVFPWTISMLETFRTELLRTTGRRAIIMPEILDLEGDQVSDWAQRRRHALREEYAQVLPDLVLARAAGYYFSLTGSEPIFAGVPVVGLFVRPSVEAAEERLSTVVESRDFDYTKVLDLALGLFPKTERIHVLGGSGPVDRIVVARFRRELQAAEVAVAIEVHDDLSFAEMEALVQGLPASNLVCCLPMRSDREGRAVVPIELPGYLAELSPVPVFTMGDLSLGHGGTGAYALPARESGLAAAAAARRILNLGEGGPGDGEPLAVAARPMVDFVELRRYGADTGAIPPDALIINRPARIWETNPGTVIAGLAISGFLLALVAALWRALVWRRAAERTLAANTDRLQRVIDATQDGLWEWNLDRNEIWWSARFFEMLGYESNAFVPDPAKIFALMHPNDVEQLWAGREEEYVREGVFEREFRIRNARGEYRWFLARGRTYPKTNGRDRLMAGTVRDITSEKEAALRELQQREALEHSLNGFDIVDADMQFVYANVAYLEMWGYESLDDLRKSSPADHCLDPGIPERVLRECDETGQCQLEFTARRKDGSNFEVFMQVRVAKDPAGRRIYAGSSLDITARKKAEASLRESESILKLALRSADLGVWDLDPETNKLVWDSRMYELFGVHDPGSMTTNEAWRLRVHPDDLERTDRDLDTAIAEGNEFHAEFRIVLPGDLTRTLEAHAVIQRDDGGKAVRVIGVNGDITERKNVDEAIRESEARLRTLLDSTEALAVQGYRSNGQIFYWNKASELLYGFAAEEVLGRNLLETIIPEEMKERVRLAMGRMMSSGIAEPAGELTLRRKDNTRVTVYSSHAVVNLRGRYELYCLDVDLTRVKRAESRLRMLNAVLRAVRDAHRELVPGAGRSKLIRSVVDIITREPGFHLAWAALTDDEAKVVDCVEARAQGLTPEIRDAIEHAQLPELAYLMSELARDISTEHSKQKFDHAPSKAVAGDLGWLMAPFGHLGVRHGYLAVVVGREELAEDGNLSLLRELCSDVGLAIRGIELEQARADSEEKYRLLADNTADCIWLMDLDHVFQYVNPSVEQFSGYTVAEWVGTRLDDHCEPRAARSARARTRRALKMLPHSPSVVFEMEIRHRDGTRIPAEVTSRLVVGEDGRPTGIQGVARNIADRKRAEAEILAAKEQAEEANRAKSEFLAVMSHEMRTPLNPILGFAGLMMNEIEDERHQGFLQTMLRAAERQLALVDKILGFARLDRDSVKTSEKEFSPIDLCRRSLADAESNLIKKLNLWFEDEPGWEPIPEGMSFRSDESMITQVLDNLIHNACKYTLEGDVVVRAGMRRNARGGMELQFSVADTGIGIPEDKQKALFLPFSQVDNSYKRQFEGAGLGLAICKKLVELLQGSIGLESEPGKGSRFWFRIPVVRVGAEAPDRSASETVSQFHMVWARAHNILIVEDRLDNAVLIEAYVDRFGGKTTLATNGLEAVAKCREEKFDLILMDLAMPEMDGLEATRHIRDDEDSRNRDTPILALTADVSGDTAARCKESGMNDYVAKPVRPLEMFRAMSRHLA